MSGEEIGEFIEQTAVQIDSNFATLTPEMLINDKNYEASFFAVEKRDYCLLQNALKLIKKAEKRETCSVENCPNVAQSNGICL